MPKNRSPRIDTIVPLLILALSACAPGGPIVAVPETRPAGLAATVIPAPAEVRPAGGAPFAITATTAVVVETAAPEVQAIAEQLAHLLRPSTGFAIPVSPSAGSGAIVLRLGGDAGLGDEGYRLEARADRLELVANRAAGLFRGVQTIRQLLPATVEMELQAGRDASWTIPAGVIVDRPRFAWRGAMLDVARHFFSVSDVKQYIDALALYKINVLHLHLSDDQGWRIEIRSRPQLAEVGGRTQVGGGPGGYYTQEEYADIVRYAQERYMTVVPEIDLPGHTNAALVAFPQLSCGTRPPALYTGTAVGFSTFCVENEETYRLIEDVMRELAALTPGPWLHMGGDEVEALTDEQYAHFVERVQEIITRTGKQMVGWEEIAKAELLPSTLVQQWRGNAEAAVRQGAKLIASPASRAYVDMKYDESTEIGLSWAALVSVESAYSWDPATLTPGITETAIYGVEAPLWTETVKNLTAAQYLVFPRLPGIAEIGWSPAARRDWSSYRYRLAAHAPRWRILGINYYRAPEVPWGR